MAALAPTCARVLSLFFAAANLEAALFVNDHNPDPDDATDGSDYLEPTWTGYARIPLAALGDPVEETAEAYQNVNALVWTPPAGATGIVFGVFIWHTTGMTLVDAAKFAMPTTVTPGKSIIARPRFRCRARTE